MVNKNGGGSALKKRSGLMITLEEQIAEAQREVALRRKCYPGWVKAGKLDAGDAKWQILVMEQIVSTLRQIDAEQRQLSLFSAGTEGGGSTPAADRALRRPFPGENAEGGATPPHRSYRRPGCHT
jgi:hypothetical protein